MSDRIQELAKQVEFHDEWFIDNPELEKFAKLIIKDCLWVVDETIKELDGFAAAGDDEFAVRSLGALQVREALEMEFGVKK
jgi:hypothetical protein